MNYVHTDRQGSVTNLSDEYGRVTARVDYDNWGAVRAYTDITIRQGFRILAPETTFAGHEYDDVLNQYYAKARMYDAEHRRFTSVDPVKGNIINPMSMVQYPYVQDSPLRWTDPLGLTPYKVTSDGVNFREATGLNSGIIGTLNTGTVVNVTNQYPYYVDGHIWTRVEYGGETGWIASEYLKNAVIKRASGVEYTVNTELLNVREWPSLTASRIGQLGANIPVTSLGEECNDGTYRWIKVKYEDENKVSRQGWVAKNYLQANPIRSDLVKETPILIDTTINVQKKTYTNDERYGTAATRIRNNAQHFIDYAAYFDIDPQILAGAIYVEQKENVNFVDTLTDWVSFYGVLDTSIGLGQIKQSTVKFLEEQGYLPPTRAVEGGWEIPFIGPIYGTERMARVKKIEVDEYNIYYAAAYIRYFIDTWESEYPQIAESPAILGSLYNLGHSKVPHANPEPNDFGILVEYYYDLMACLLGLGE